jgi:hypothetical protein
MKRKRYLDSTMTEKKRAPRRYVVCVKNKGYRASLERNKIYAALPDPDAEAKGDIRVIDESGADYLFPADYFEAIEVPSRGFPSQGFELARRRQTRE